ncbi:Hypothetical predicted protein [Mytilus galloprovincialis]|uniref:Uncharacterized protein n=1 Tax=Mytilus galloprovincialis TaxID=29158 RepID=A0A8B6C3L2_MYTGA|nr:Hypothetical predicted protein [Mytilus galloprovincialis]
MFENSKLSLRQCTDIDSLKILHPFGNSDSVKVGKVTLKTSPERVDIPDTDSTETEEQDEEDTEAVNSIGFACPEPGCQRELRKQRTENGTKMFSPAEWLSVSQIKSLFAGFASKQHSRRDIPHALHVVAPDQVDVNDVELRNVLSEIEKLGDTREHVTLNRQNFVNRT